MSSRCIAMWSGPRNISTAMMRAWENRSDTVVVDEPFYAHFLDKTGIDHPMRDDIVAEGETDWQTIVSRLVAKPATGLFYQKHITTHWLEDFKTDWLAELSHVFLIRDPEPVAASYAVKRNSVTASDLGYSQQSALFRVITEMKGKTPTVIDSKRFLQNPESQLKTLCEVLGIAFEKNMLSWPQGARESDGIWGAHWYDAVNQSTGFKPPRTTHAELTDIQQDIANKCRPYYEELLDVAI